MRSKTNNQNTLILPAELSDVSAATFLKKLDRLLVDSPEHVALDCTQLESINSSQIGFLWQAQQKCEKNGTEIQLLSPSPGLICVLKVLDLYEIFKYLPAREFEQIDYPGNVIPESSYADEYHPDVESIEKALTGFLVYLKSLSLQHLTIFELQTLFYEVSTNIQTHSGMPPEESILFTARTNENKIVLAFADSGSHYDLTKHQAKLDPEKAGKNKQKRGFGIALINKLADKIEYLGKQTELNVLILEKRWH